MRDIKPDNIMIECNGRTQMCDLGLSKDLNDRTEQCLTYCGTPEYMAPEVCLIEVDTSTLVKKHPMYDRGFYSYEVDFWSMAITLYEMAFLGEMPFKEADDPEMRIAVASKAITAFRDFALRHKEERFNMFLRRMLRKDLTKRLGPVENKE